MTLRSILSPEQAKQCLLTSVRCASQEMTTIPLEFLNPQVFPLEVFVPQVFLPGSLIPQVFLSPISYFRFLFAWYVGGTINRSLNVHRIGLGLQVGVPKVNIKGGWDCVSSPIKC